MQWTANERRILSALKTPAHIQQYLDELEYDETAGAASPRANPIPAARPCSNRWPLPRNARLSAGNGA